MAAKEKCDGFLQLVSGGQPLVGESSDAEFPGAIEFQSFHFGNSSGFTDTASPNAAQDKSKGAAVAKSRVQQSGAMGFANQFRGGAQNGSKAGAAELKEFEGKDLADEAACNFQIVKSIDLASPNLFRAYCSCQDLEHREVFESATISLRKATGGRRSTYLRFTFNDLLIVGYTLDIGSDGLGKETVSLSFAKIRAEYRKQSNTGELGAAVKGGWDFIERASW